jgi:hypothetical protein
MKIYFAVGSREYLYLLLVCGVKNILCSFAYPEPYLSNKVLKKHGIKMMIDSGAFTAWSKGKQVNIDDYIAFIKKHNDIIDPDQVVNLDVIKGGRDQANQNEFNEACKKGFENYYYIKEKTGHDPIHVFHQGDNFIWLEKMLRECKYIGVSPNKDASQDAIDKWLYDCFYIIKNSDNPDIKTHAFGLTSEELLMKYPYTTADSSAWALTSAFGTVLTPYGRVLISDIGKNDIDFIENKTPQIKELIIQYIESFGFSYNLAKDSKRGYKYRNILNIFHFMNMQDRLNSEPRVFNDGQKFLFDPMEMDKKRHQKLLES